MVIQTDDEDAPALTGGVIDATGYRPRIKFPAWDRWKDLDVYLVGCVTAPRNGDPEDLRRNNLIPVQRAWERYKCKS